MSRPNPENRQFFVLPNGMRLSATPDEIVKHPPITREVLTATAREVVLQPTREGGPLVTNQTPEGQLARRLLANKIGEALTGLNEQPGTPAHRRAVNATEEILAMGENKEAKPKI